MYFNRDDPFIIQIYEVQAPEEAEKLIALGVNHIGSVVVSDMAWQVRSIRATIELTAQTNARSSLIPLFRDADLISTALDYYRPDIVHFCDNLMVSQPRTTETLFSYWRRFRDIQATVRERFPEIKMMRSIPVRQTGVSGNTDSVDGDLIEQLVDVFEPLSDFFLTDTLLEGKGPTNECVQPVSGFIGITGLPCDWEQARRLVRLSSLPVILAGGLSPGNVYDGVMQTIPAGVDSCTCTNQLDPDGRPIRFKKDIEKVRQFIEAAQRAVKALENQIVKPE